MKVLELGANYFSVTIPKCIGDLSALNVLDLSHNNFDPQPFPNVLSMFNNLEILKLRSSNLHGKIDNVFNLPSLQVLDIAANHLDGELTESLVQSKVLKTVDVSSNHFSGIIPMLSDVLSHGYYGMNSFSGDLLELLI